MATMHLLLTEAAQVDSGDTAWIIVCTALVLLMTPGLAFFYAGMVRSKHALGMIMQSFVTIAIVSVTWVLVGYSLAFDHDAGGGLVGGLHLAGLTHAEVAVPGMDLTIPPLAFVTFQLMFAILTAALISGASADRMRFGAFVTFITIWSVVVYAPLAHWAWSPEGWLNKAGLLDFAGGTVVEICSGASALALALVIGPRRGWPREMMAPHNLPLALIGAGLLWFGWIGFNAGSALSAGYLAANAALATQLSGVGGMIGWLVLEKRLTTKATTLGAASGAVAGLVAITPAAGFLSPLPALLLGVTVRRRQPVRDTAKVPIQVRRLARRRCRPLRRRRHRHPLRRLCSLRRRSTPRSNTRACCSAAVSPSSDVRASACSRQRPSHSPPPTRSRGFCVPRSACGSRATKKPKVSTPASTPRPRTSSPPPPVWEGFPDEAHHRDRQAVQGG